VSSHLGVLPSPPLFFVAKGAFQSHMGFLSRGTRPRPTRLRLLFPPPGDATRHALVWGTFYDPPTLPSRKYRPLQSLVAGAVFVPFSSSDEPPSRMFPWVDMRLFALFPYSCVLLSATTKNLRMWSLVSPPWWAPTSGLRRPLHCTSCRYLPFFLISPPPVSFFSFFFVYRFLARVIDTLFLSL